MSDFVHLHVHSHYSLIDGTPTIGKLVDAALAAEMPALAVTDHGNMFGAMEFYQKAKAKGLKPILGMEAYVAERDHKAKGNEPGNSTFHLTLLCQNATGYHNLVKLSSLAYIDGFYRRPRIDRELLAQHSEGLIGLSGCLSGEIVRNINRDKFDQAVEVAGAYRDILGQENYFIELMDNGLEQQKKVLGGLERLADHIGAHAVATNDIHYLSPDDATSQEVRIAIATGKVFNDTNRLKLETEQFYFKTTEEMLQVFRHKPEAVTNTLRVAELSDIQLDLDQHHLPTFEVPTDESLNVYFRRMCHEGCVAIYGQYGDAVQKRLDYEMGVISKMGFEGYFLITSDFIRFARENCIPVGPGRGSAAGSLVAYALGITQIDPLKYDLLFERFLNSERISMPDIDIDFCRDGRERVIEYVRDRYGHDNVSQIITFGTMAARAVIRDVGRVLDIPLAEVDRIVKKIPGTPGTKLPKVLESDKELQEVRDSSDQHGQLIDIALKLEGLCRHASTHAAGVVIADKPLMEYVPLYKNGDDLATQYPMNILEDIGLLKMDFLGLKTLTIIDKARKIIRESRNVDLDIDALPLDDEKTYRMLSEGDGIAVFQLESRGMRELLTRMKPDRFEDLIALLALYRPGPLGSGMDDLYVRRKHGEEEVQYQHPILEQVLSESMGVLIYQEQVMRIANVMGGFSLNEADSLRKAMGKKKPELLAKFRQQFIDGSAANDVDKKVATEIWEMMEYFAGYGFNKSHSTAYALITYQTAFLKAHYPAEFMTAVLTCDMDNSDKVKEYVAEIKRLGFALLPPDINQSVAEFSVHSEGVRFGLAAVKGVGLKAVELMIELREKIEGGFRSLFHVCEEVDTRQVNKASLEALAKCGAFDSVHPNRAAVHAVIEDAMKMGAARQKDRLAGQGNLFDAPAEDDEPELDAPLPDIPAWDESERLGFEKETLGLYVSGHPLQRYQAALRAASSARIPELVEFDDGETVQLGGMITSVRPVLVKKGKHQGEKMALFQLEGLDGSVSSVIFTAGYAQYKDLIQDERIVVLRGTVDRNREEPSLKVTEILPVEDAMRTEVHRVVLRIDAELRESDVLLPKLRTAFEAHGGDTPVYLRIDTEGGHELVRVGRKLYVSPTEDFCRDLEGLVGRERLVLQ